MYMVDRGIIIVQPKQPFVDWINRTVERSSPVTLQELKDDCTVFLVPEQDSIEQMLAYLQPIKPKLFEMELESWNRDRSAWPPERTEALFDVWFELHAHSAIFDLVDGPISKEGGGLPVDLTGTWIVVSSPDFDDDYLAMETTPYVKLERDGDEISGDFHVGLISGSLWGVVVSDHVQFSFEGMDEMDPVSGAGMLVGKDDQMTFALQFHDRDTFTFDCVREKDVV
jgi:hypothetical protein